MNTRERDRRREKYHRDRATLVKALGGKCEECDATENLEFHHTCSRTWVCRKLNRLQRLRVYTREAAEGNILLLCRSCNAEAAMPELPDPPF